MSVDIQWETLTAGEDGARLAEVIRAFIHDKFQQITPPRFIRSVHVHSFDFGTIPPELELKDICDPLPDFYDDSDEDEDEDDSSVKEEGESSATAPKVFTARGPGPAPNELPFRFPSPFFGIGLPSDDHPAKRPQRPVDVDSGRSQSYNVLGNAGSVDRRRDGNPLSSFQSPGIPGGTANLSYFHLPLSAGISGTATPLAAVAGAHFHRPVALRHNTVPELQHAFPSPLSSPSSPGVNSRPPSQPRQESRRGSPTTLEDRILADLAAGMGTSQSEAEERSPEDIQVVTHVRYSGNLNLSLTADILLDYPMPSFVGIPLKLNITGLVFDGIAILAYIKKRAHFCFLSPEDAEALVGRENDLEDKVHTPSTTGRPRFGGLLEQIRVESEIGDKQTGKTVLKNVGKVEKFVLDQVRRIFEDELVYPSFWTFLV